MPSSCPNMRGIGPANAAITARSTGKTHVRRLRRNKGRPTAGQNGRYSVVRRRIVDLWLLTGRAAARLLCESEGLDNSYVGDPSALAHRLQSVALAARPEGVNESRHQLRTGRAKWMPYRNRAAIDVEPFWIGVKRAQPSERHWREGFIDLERSMSLIDMPDRPVRAVSQRSAPRA